MKKKDIRGVFLLPPHTPPSSRESIIMSWCRYMHLRGGGSMGICGMSRFWNSEACKQERRSTIPYTSPLTWNVFTFLRLFVVITQLRAYGDMRWHISEGEQQTREKLKGILGLNIWNNLGPAHKIPVWKQNKIKQSTHKDMSHIKDVTGPRPMHAWYHKPVHKHSHPFPSQHNLPLVKSCLSR